MEPAAIQKMTFIYFLLFAVVLRALSLKKDHQMQSKDPGVSELFQFAAEINTVPTSSIQWQQWAQSDISANDDRQRVVTETLGSVAGVYRNKTKSRLLGLEKTIMVNVISYSAADSKVHQEVLRNWFCFVRHYEFEPLVYVLHHDIMNGTAPGDVINKRRLRVELEKDLRLGISGQVLSYPDSLFWSLIATKTTWTDPRRKRGHVDYTGNKPTFKNFGAFVMLVPLLEVLNAGYSVIYFDIDVLFIRDPIPFMILGNADFVISPETRSCKFFTQPARVMFTEWNKIEPNTGIMHVRHGGRGPQIFRTWLLKLVQENSANDQPSLRHLLQDMSHTTDCLWNYSGSFFPRNNADREPFRESSSAAPAHRICNNSSNSDDRTSYSNRNGSYCFLSDLLFQNGMYAFHCGESMRKGGGDFGEFMLAMDSVGAIENYDSSGILNSASSYKYPGVRRKSVRAYIAPVAIHLNYVQAKARVASERGLWLLNDSYFNAGGDAGSLSGASGQRACRRYDISSSKYGSMKWLFQLDAVREELLLRLKTFFDSHGISPIGATVMFPRLPQLYMIDANYLLRIAPNWESTEILQKAMNLPAGKEYLLGDRIFKSMQLGPTLPNLKGDLSLLNSTVRSILEPGVPLRYRSHVQQVQYNIGDPRQVPTVESLTSLIPSASASRATPSTIRAHAMTSARTYWETLADMTAAAEPLRRTEVEGALSAMSGIYRNAERSKLAGLEKSVLLTVVTSQRQVLMLHNWLCHAQNHGLRTVVYILPTADDDSRSSDKAVGGFGGSGWGGGTAMRSHDVRTKKQQLSSTLSISHKMNKVLKSLQQFVLANTTQIVTYPQELFWRIVARRRKWQARSTTLPSFEGNTPSVENFGSFLTLIPILEALGMGYNALYVTIDASFMTDPVPSLTAGWADFNIASSYTGRDAFLDYVGPSTIADPAVATGNSYAGSGTSTDTTSPLTKLLQKETDGMRVASLVNGTTSSGAGVAIAKAKAEIDLKIDSSIVHVRATEVGKRVLTSLILHTIDTGEMTLRRHIQTAIPPSSIFGADIGYSESCNENNGRYRTTTVSNQGSFVGRKEDVQGGQKRRWNGTYCVFSDVRVQRRRDVGTVLKDRYWGDTYRLAMNSSAVSTEYAGKVVKIPAILLEDGSEGETKEKIRKLEEMGLWLVSAARSASANAEASNSARRGLTTGSTTRSVRSSSSTTTTKQRHAGGGGGGGGATTTKHQCRASVNVAVTPWTQVDWQKDVEKSMVNIRAVTNLPDGTAIRTSRSPTVYILVKGMRRAVPDFATLEALKSRVEVVQEDSLYFKWFPEGDPLPKLQQWA